MKEKKRVLLCPLNWGLGHATRCIPIIHSLMANNAEVIIASDGLALDFLKEEFPELKSFTLPSYNIRYDSANMVWNMAWQIPSILNTIRKENQAVKTAVETHQPHAIISDNRFGCYHPKITSIFITHQINIITPFPLLSRLASYWNKNFINKFSQCWIPDNESAPRLSGKLSLVKKSNRIQYIGPLSRMQYKKSIKKYDLVIVLSGPEPQRSELEEILINQLRDANQSVLLVRGKMDSGEPSTIRPGFQSISYLNSQALNAAILSADLVISRSGYSSIMDYARLGCKAIMVPTPGQTEQEYLAEFFEKEKIFFSQSQSDLNIQEALRASVNYTGLEENYFTDKTVNQAISSMLSSI